MDSGSNEAIHEDRLKRKGEALRRALRRLGNCAYRSDRLLSFRTDITEASSLLSSLCWVDGKAFTVGGACQHLLSLYHYITGILSVLPSVQSSTWFCSNQGSNSPLSTTQRTQRHTLTSYERSPTVDLFPSFRISTPISTILECLRPLSKMGLFCPQYPSRRYRNGFPGERRHFCLPFNYGHQPAVAPLRRRVAFISHFHSSSTTTCAPNCRYERVLSPPSPRQGQATAHTQSELLTCAHILCFHPSRCFVL